jgi:methyl-accepting chemotaxis protein
MAQLEPYKDELQKEGALLFYIAAEKRQGMFKQKYLSEHPISFPFLLDEDRTVTKDYGVYHRLGKDAINIARTATFVIDTHQRVRFIFVGKSQTDRAPFNDVLAAVREAKQPTGPANGGV